MDKLIDPVINAGQAFITKRYNDNTGIKEKLFDLELMVLKIRSSIELAEQANILGSLRPSLVAWMSRLEDTAKEGDDVLREFNNRRQTQRGVVGSSSSSCSSWRWNIIKRWNIVKRLFFGDTLVNRLNKTITWLKRACADTKEFREVLGVPSQRIGIVPLTAMYMLGNKRRQMTSLHYLWEQITAGMRHMIGCFTAVITWPMRFITRNQQTRARVEGLLSRVSYEIESREVQSDGKPWLTAWLTKMREAVTQGKNALETMKYPWNGNGLDALEKRIERIVQDWDEFWHVKRNIDERNHSMVRKLMSMRLRVRVSGRLQVTKLSFSSIIPNKKYNYVVKNLIT